MLVCVRARVYGQDCGGASGVEEPARLIYFFLIRKNQLKNIIGRRRRRGAAPRRKSLRENSRRIETSIGASRKTPRTSKTRHAEKKTIGKEKRRKESGALRERMRKKMPRERMGKKNVPRERMGKTRERIGRAERKNGEKIGARRCGGVSISGPGTDRTSCVCVRARGGWCK